MDVYLFKIFQIVHFKYMPFILHQLYFNKAIKHSFHYNYTFTVTILSDFVSLGEIISFPSIEIIYLKLLSFLFFSFGAGD